MYLCCGDVKDQKFTTVCSFDIYHEHISGSCDPVQKASFEQDFAQSCGRLKSVIWPPSKIVGMVRLFTIPFGQSNLKLRICIDNKKYRFTLITSVQRSEEQTEQVVSHNMCD